MTQLNHYYRFLRVCIFSGIINFVLPASDHIINIPNQGKINGIELSKFRIQKIIAYYGIPYAQPPIDKLRFAPPEINDLPKWNDTKFNTDYSPSCLQDRADYKESELPFFKLLTDTELPSNISEDCLYLNIFVPNVPAPAEGYATIIWIHPGNFTTGMPSIWNPHTFVYRQRVIVVTFAWRLNIMGFFTTNDGEAAGNYGLMDQQAAMIWINNNIRLFGGNENNICLMGSGTGAISVALHMINENSRDLFHKAILMSGHIFHPYTIRNPEEDQPIINELAKEYGCTLKPTSLFINCLRRADADKLVEHTSNINWRPSYDEDLSNITSAFIAQNPKEYFLRHDYANIPILTGYTNMEQVLELGDLDNITNEYSSDTFRKLIIDLIYEDVSSVNSISSIDETTSSSSSSSLETSCSINSDHIIDSVTFFYEPSLRKYDAELFRQTAVNLLLEKTYGSSTIFLASKLSEINQNVFVYRFDLKPNTKNAIENLPNWMTGVPHLFDLLYVWGVPYWRQQLANQQWDYRDKRISDIVMTFWANFAKHSDPTKNSIYPIKWEPYRNDAPGILIIDNSFNMSNSNNLNYKAFSFWNDFYPKVLNVSSECCATSTAIGFLRNNINFVILSFIFIL